MVIQVYLFLLKLPHRSIQRPILLRLARF